MCNRCVIRKKDNETLIQTHVYQFSFSIFLLFNLFVNREIGIATMSETITIHLNYKKVLREVFFHFNKKRSEAETDDYFDMYQIYEYVPESQASKIKAPTCSSDCGDESKLIKVLFEMLHSDSGEMQQLIRNFFKKREFVMANLFCNGNYSYF